MEKSQRVFKVGDIVLLPSGGRIGIVTFSENLHDVVEKCNEVVQSVAGKIFFQSANIDEPFSEFFGFNGEEVDKLQYLGNLENLLMKRPRVALLISPDEVQRIAILDGSKRVTIREGLLDYRVDDEAMFCCHLVPWAVMARITNVRHCKLSEIMEKEWLADGYKTKEGMLEDLRRSYYKDLNWDSLVTVIYWDDVRGTLVDDFRRKSQPPDEDEKPDDG